jgi:D-glycerate 3-kinase
MLPDTIDIVEQAVRARVAAASQSPVIVGICGAQGSGKSTLAGQLQRRLATGGMKVAVLALDDLYLSRAERARLAAAVHPLFRTRGVPGTHNVALGEAVLDGLAHDGTTYLPRFDKRQDMPLPRAQWEPVDGPVDVVLFEGWCVGARPIPEDQLAQPINALERDEDTDGVWRRHFNAVLGREYRRLFDRIHMLVLLAAPDFKVVAGWRTEQEETLRRHLIAAGQSTEGLMTEAQVARFVLYYERLTTYILAEMPGRADLTVRLDASRRPVAIG